MLFEYSDLAGLGTGDGVVIVINTFHRGGALSHFVIMFSLGWLLLGDSGDLVPGVSCGGGSGS